MKQIDCFFIDRKNVLSGICGKSEEGTGNIQNEATKEVYYDVANETEEEEFKNYHLFFYHPFRSYPNKRKIKTNLKALKGLVKKCLGGRKT